MVGSTGLHTLLGRARAGVETSGELVVLAWQSVRDGLVDIVRGRFSWPELWFQAWFMTRVSLLPTILVAIPFGVITSVQIGAVASQIGATSFSGAVNGIGVLRQGAPLVTSLMIAGAVGSAICSDLGARTIREEIEAMEVMGLNVIERLVVPRLLAAVLVSVMLCALVTLVGVGACYLYEIYLNDASGGGFLRTLGEYGRLSDFATAMVKSAFFGITSALIAAFKGLHAKGGPSGVADAVNEAVVLAFVMVFVVNTVLSQMYTVMVPAVGTY